MQRRWPAAAIPGALAVGTLVAVLPGQVAGASAVVVKASPSTGLVDGQTVTISGRGLVHSYHGSAQTWFVTECSAAVHGHVNPATDTPHCDITDAKGLRVARNGAFVAHYRVTTGIIGDGYCGTPGHLTCVLGVGTAQGLGTVVHITFKTPAPPGPAASPSNPTTSTTGTTR